jgi:hypothetical protein
VDLADDQRRLLVVADDLSLRSPPVRRGGRRPGTCAGPSLRLGGDGYDRVVQGPADRVLADRYTGEPGDDGGGGRLS